MRSAQSSEQSHVPAPRSVLAVAAHSLMHQAHTPATMADMLHGRAVKHYREGLRQYLAIRTGDLEYADTLFREVKHAIAEIPASELVEAPGVRARLYRIARERVLAACGHEAPSAAELARIPWRSPRPDAPVTASMLRPLRTRLNHVEAELLELRHARELGPAEIAFVLDRPVEEVLDELATAAEHARQLIKRLRGAKRTNLRRILLEAFALDTRGATPLYEDRDPLPTGTVLGSRYVIDRRVGLGAFGDVYRAKDAEVPGHVVALKLLHESAQSDRARGEALRELHLTASVFHPSIVQFKDHGWHEGRLWFVMPWYEGETLEARLLRAPLSRLEGRRIFEPLARGLAAMHASGIRHQDIKPDNILLAKLQGGETLPVLLDLGVAAKDAEMVVAGTPTYFAPEVAAQFSEDSDKPRVSAKADVFALALSLRNALDPGSQSDIPAGAVDAFIGERARHAPSPPTTTDLAFLRPHFERWLHLDPERRPTAEQFLDELAILTSPEDRQRRRRAVLRWLVPTIITATVALGSMAFALHRTAELEKDEAERARLAAANLRVDLEASREQGLALERDVESIRQSYEESRMTRQQLAQELSRAQSQLAQARRQRAATEEELRRTEETLARIGAELDAKRRALTERDAELEQVNASLTAARRRGDQLESQLNAERRERTELGAQVATLEAQLGAERAKSSRLESGIDAAIRAQATAEAELREVQRRLQQLESQRSPQEAPQVADPLD